MTNTQNTQIATKDQSITDYINQDSVYSQIESILKDRTPQFVTSIVSLTNADKGLKEADKKSLLGACLTATALNLPISASLGFAYIIPYKDKKSGTTVAQFQMGYKGFIQLALNSGKFKTINVTDVREGEIKDVDRLSGEIYFKWRKKNRDKYKITGYVAYMKLVNGFEKSLYMTEAELKKHGVRFSQTAKRGYGLWIDDFDAMAKKTVIKLLLSKYAPMTNDMARAQESDQSIVTEDGYKYLDNKPVNPHDEANDKELKRIENYIGKAKTVEEVMEAEEAVMDSENEKLKKILTEKIDKLRKNEN